MEPDTNEEIQPAPLPPSRIQPNGALCDRCNKAFTTRAIANPSKCEFTCSEQEATKYWDKLPCNLSVSDRIQKLMEYLGARAKFVPQYYEYICASCMTPEELAHFESDDDSAAL